MDRNFNFKIGQRVTKRDEYNFIVKGEVVDTTTVNVFIKWEDCNEPIEHQRHEYEFIHLDRKRK